MATRPKTHPEPPEDGDRWTVRGVSKARQIKAKKVAATCGLSTGEWLSAGIDAAQPGAALAWPTTAVTARSTLADTARPPSADMVAALAELVAAQVALAGAKGVPIANRRLLNDALAWQAAPFGRPVPRLAAPAAPEMSAGVTMADSGQHASNGAG